VDYLLRQGCYETAIKFSTNTNLTEFVDIDIFLAGKKVLDCFEKKSCKEAILWCNENKSKLKKK